ncbi:hypothetical protein NE848_15290 [Gramella jeungdoensis]|uniref:Tetratricopeptide repeat protein n=1 Tax=Gramella jeungdoensis TaxID=708091 RepID=A0ABT0Z5F5_9FLAO|nr:hypothetical protein [Gramella jeungdoensis]MCM8570759.1 hypothetical protein [Gramella jeungdoensis]
MLDTHILERAKNSWEKPIGIVLTLIFILGAYFWILNVTNLEIANDNSEIFRIWIPSFLLIILSIYWLISTYRLPGVKKKDITIGIFLKFDEEKDKYENRFKDLVRNILRNINEEHPEIETRLYPINYFKSEKKLVKYVQSMNYSLDTAIYAEVSGGNYLKEDGNSDFKLVIDKINFTGNFNINENLRIFKDNISISREVELRNAGKEWAIVEKNNGIDKVKFKRNFKDLILHYAGIYLIYLNNLDAALSILKKLKHSENIKFRELGPNTISKRELAIQGRINYNLINLLMLRASRAYILEGNKEKSREILKECELLFGDHPESFSQFISLARNSYELGHIDEAISYNEKAAALKPTAQEIFINRAFFGIIQKDYKKIHKNFFELGHLYRFKNTQSYVDIVAFIDREKKKIKATNCIYDFAIGFYYFFYIDEKEGRKILKKFIDETKNKPDLDDIRNLAIRFITKGSFKSVYSNKKKKNRKRKKRRK